MRTIFPKSEKLCTHIAIDQLYKEGKRFEKSMKKALQRLAIAPEE